MLWDGWPMPRKTLGLAITMDQTEGIGRLWCLWAVLEGAGGRGAWWQSQGRRGTWWLCRASGALAGSLSPRQCLPAAKPKSGHENRALPPCSSFVVINQITVISLREKLRFYL